MAAGTVADVLDLVFCATGDVPMFAVAATDSGKLLSPWDPLTPPSGATLPLSALRCLHKPRQWLGEPAQMGDMVRFDDTLLDSGLPE
jgi:hypothetical protein